MSALITYLLISAFGFIAQLVDGSLGMAYGVSATSLLLAMNLTPAVASATTHTAEVFTTFASGLSHLKFGNVDRKMFMRLVVPGAVSAIVGSVFLVNIDLSLVSPFVSVYLLCMGVIVCLRSFKERFYLKNVNDSILALLGGFFDAVGGGGWGPIVTSSLIAKGENPRKTIGTVNASEFFVTVAEAVTFAFLLGFRYPYMVLALIIGGLLSAPLGGYIVSRIDAKKLMLVVGTCIIFLQIWRFLK